MASIKGPSFLCSSSKHSQISSSCQTRIVRATVSMPRFQNSATPSLVPKLPTRGNLMEELEFANSALTLPKLPITFTKPDNYDTSIASDPQRVTIEKMYAIMEAVADRVEMHKNIGEQRNNWNSLLLTSINAITLTAATMAGIAAASVVSGAPIAALKLSSTLMYLGATAMLVIMNKIQPSQLAEEQRNATRLFKQLHSEIKTKIAIETPTIDDVNRAMEKVLALDKAYPLPLLGAMLEKFPSKVEPAVWWWPQQRKSVAKGIKNGMKNGWNGKLEEELREIVRVLEIKDKDDYLRLGEKALKLNKVLAIAGPVLTGLGAIASACNGSCAVEVGVVAAAVACIVNTLEHGGQVGMVFEMYRSNAGFFRLMKESIESNLNEGDLKRRENGELFEMKVAMNLGRSLSELRELAGASSKIRQGKDIKEFGSKLF